MEVFGGESFLQQYLNHSLQATLGDGLIVLRCAWSACFGKYREFLALYAAGEGAQSVHFLTAHVRAVVGKLNVVFGASNGCLLALLTVVELALQVVVVLFGLLSEC